MGPEELLALTKVNLPKGLRDQVKPGEYSIDTVVRLKGGIKVGEGYESSVPNSIPWKALFFLAAAKQNQRTRDAFARDCLEAFKAGELNKEALAAAEEQLQPLAAALLGETVQPFQGKVTGSVEVLPVTLGNAVPVTVLKGITDTVELEVK